MALTIEQFKAMDSLKDLDDAILTIIATTTASEEAAQIQSAVNKRTGEIHGDYDKEFGSVLGVEKPAGKPSSLDFWKDQVTTLKSSGDEITKLKATIEDQKKLIESGSTDTALKAEHERLKTDLKNKQDAFNDLQTKYTNDIAAKEEALKAEQSSNIGIRANYGFDSGLIEYNVKFKSFSKDESEDKAVIVGFQDQAKSRILSKYEIIEQEFGTDGKKRMVLKDRQSGKIFMDPDTNFAEPMTLGKAYVTELKPIIDAGQKQPGGGTGGNGGGGNGGGDDKIGSFVVTGKTKVECGEQITNYLLSKGLSKLDNEFVEHESRLNQENAEAMKDLPFSE